MNKKDLTLDQFRGLVDTIKNKLYKQSRWVTRPESCESIGTGHKRTL
jgi:hypothetical protein